MSDSSSSSSTGAISASDCKAATIQATSNMVWAIIHGARRAGLPFVNLQSSLVNPMEPTFTNDWSIVVTANSEGVTSNVSWANATPTTPCPPEPNDDTVPIDASDCVALAQVAAVNRMWAMIRMAQGNLQFNTILPTIVVTFSAIDLVGTYNYSMTSDGTSVSGNTTIDWSVA